MEINSNSRMAFYRILQDKSDRYLIALLQRVVDLVKNHEGKLEKAGLTSPYKSSDLERVIRTAASRAEILELVELIYSDPYLQLLQAQDMLNSSSISPAVRPIDVASPVQSPVQSPMSLFSDYTPKSNLSKYNSALGGSKQRRTRSKRGRRVSRR